jgi:hypothetical protein
MALVTIEPSSTAAESAASPFTSATANIQAAARWVVTALAAVGGVLVSSVPLTGLGKFTSFLEALAAGIGLVVALAAVAVTIVFAARVFTTEHITLAALVSDQLPTRAGGGPPSIEVTIRQIMRSREELFGDAAKDLGELSRRLASVNKNLRENATFGVAKGESQPPSSAHVVQAEVATSAATLAEAGLASYTARLQIAARTVVEFANYDTARRNFRIMTSILLVAGFFAVAGVADYAYWSSRPARQIDKPTPVIVSLPRGSSQGRSLGINCNTAHVSAVAVGGTIRRPTIVTVPANSCNARRFRVPSGSVVIPAKSLPSP